MPESNIGPTRRSDGFPEKMAPFEVSGERPRRRVPTACQLLVSVRSASEARQAALGQADIIDVKEPRQGALGAATPTVWREIAEAVDAAQPLSVALGEARQQDEPADVLFPPRLARALAALPPRFQYAKLGPAGVAEATSLQRRWRQVRAALSPTCQFVAVAYADAAAAGSLPPEAILRQAAAAGIEWWLLDTFEKRGRTVIDVLGPTRLAALAQQAHQHGLRWVLAGSMRRSDPPIWDRWNPAVIGVRGDVCRGGRTGTLDVEAIVQWRQRLAPDRLESPPRELD